LKNHVTRDLISGFSTISGRPIARVNAPRGISGGACLLAETLINYNEQRGRLINTRTRAHARKIPKVAGLVNYGLRCAAIPDPDMSRDNLSPLW